MGNTDQEDWRGKDSETTIRQKVAALKELDANVNALFKMPLQDLDLDRLRVAVRNSKP